MYAYVPPLWENLYSPRPPPSFHAILPATTILRDHYQAIVDKYHAEVDPDIFSFPFLLLPLFLLLLFPGPPHIYIFSSVDIRAGGVNIGLVFPYPTLPISPLRILPRTFLHCGKNDYIFHNPLPLFPPNSSLYNCLPMLRDH